MTHQDPLDKLLTDLMQDVANDVPEQAAAVAAYRELELASQEKDEKGNPTPKAHRAMTRLRHPFQVEESIPKSIHKAETQIGKLRTEFAKALPDILTRWARLREYERKVAILKDSQSPSSSLEKSRQTHDPDSMFALGLPLIEMLAAQGVSPSAMGRLPAIAMKFIAELINAHSRDPKFADPDNVWNRIVRAGVLEAYRNDLDEEERKVLAYAWSHRAEKTNEWAAKARRDLELPAGFSEGFLEGAAQIAHAVGELPDGLTRSYWEAYSLGHSPDIKLLGQTLKLTSDSELQGLATVVHLVNVTRPEFEQDTRVQLSFFTMKRAIDKIELHNKPKGEWIPEFMDLLPDLARNLEGTIDSVEAFNMLLKEGLYYSAAKRVFYQAQEDERREQEELHNEYLLRLACEFGDPFKLVGGIVIWKNDEEYDDVDAEEWTGDRWLSVHGCLPGDEADDDDPDDEPLGEETFSGINDASTSPDPEAKIEDVAVPEVGSDDETDDVSDYDWDEEEPDLSELYAEIAANKQITEAFAQASSGSPVRSENEVESGDSESSTAGDGEPDPTPQNHDGAHFFDDQSIDDRAVMSGDPEVGRATSNDETASREASSQAAETVPTKPQLYIRKALEDYDDEDFR